MTRKEFIRICGLFGVIIPFQTSVIASSLFTGTSNGFSGKVIIIGAGAGGLSAGYLLYQLGIDFVILEASSCYGGRMKINTDFADFPIPLGAEWIETRSDIFSEILNDDSVQCELKTIEDAPDFKFAHSSWFNFYEEYILPHILSKIEFNSVVDSIDYTDEKIVVSSSQGRISGDKIIVSVPLKILQDGDIQFIPDLPKGKKRVIKKSLIWDGFKAFFEFSNTFYDAEFEIVIDNSAAGQKIFYDATFGQNSGKHIIGLFAVGNSANRYNELSDNELKDLVLNELDNLFLNQASLQYKSHISQNWNKEPYIRGGYLTDHADWKDVRVLGKSIGSKVYFAGGAYTDGENWVSVHEAAKSAKRAVDEILVSLNTTN